METVRRKQGNKTPAPRVRCDWSGVKAARCQQSDTDTLWSKALLPLLALARFSPLPPPPAPHTALHFTLHLHLSSAARNLIILSCCAAATFFTAGGSEQRAKDAALDNNSFLSAQLESEVKNKALKVGTIWDL